MKDWLQATAGLLSGTEPHYPQNWRLGGHQSWSGHFGNEKNLFPLPGIEPRIVQPAA
jgi:hypothetical protein